LVRNHIENGFPVHVRRYHRSAKEQFAPLALQAWAWQKHVLLTHVIHFTESEIQKHPTENAAQNAWEEIYEM
jgi:hypothetical protein